MKVKSGAFIGTLLERLELGVIQAPYFESTYWHIVTWSLTSLSMD